MSEVVASKIKKMIDSHNIFVFMKGTKDFPMCGFSGTVIEILKSYDVSFETFNVLDDPEIRQGIKDYSDWPTIPQVFVQGEFIGGCDILLELHESGELKSQLRI